MARPTAATVNERIDREVLPAIVGVETRLTAKLDEQTAELTQKIEENSLNGLKPTLLTIAHRQIEQLARSAERRSHWAWLLYWPDKLLGRVRDLKVLAGMVGFVATAAWMVNGLVGVWHLFQH